MKDNSANVWVFAGYKSDTNNSEPKKEQEQKGSKPSSSKKTADQKKLTNFDLLVTRVSTRISKNLPLPLKKKLQKHLLVEAYGSQLPKENSTCSRKVMKEVH